MGRTSEGEARLRAIEHYAQRVEEDIYSNAPWEVAHTFAQIHETVLLEANGILDFGHKFGAVLILYDALVREEKLQHINVLSSAVEVFKMELYHGDAPMTGHRTAFHRFIGRRHNGSLPTETRKNFRFQDKTLIGTNAYGTDPKANLRRYLTGAASYVEADAMFKTKRLSSKLDDFQLIVSGLREESENQFSGKLPLMLTDWHALWVDVMDVAQALRKAFASSKLISIALHHDRLTSTGGLVYPKAATSPQFRQGEEFLLDVEFVLAQIEDNIYDREHGRDLHHWNGIELAVAAFNNARKSFKSSYCYKSFS